MRNTKRKVLERESKTNTWRLGLVMAVTVVAAMALSGAVGGKPAPGTASENSAIESNDTHTVMVVDFGGQMGKKTFEIKDFSFGVENPTTIGSATGGAGAGKIKFNEFQITKTTDSASPVFFKNCASGTHYTEVLIIVNKVDKKGNETPFMKFNFNTVFTTKIDWSGPGDEGPEESITFVYGKMGVSYFERGPTGNFTEIHTGWNQVTNKSDDSTEDNS